MRVAGALAALVCGLARGKEEIFEMIESKVFDERPTIEVFTNSTFDPSTIPLLVEQAQMLVPYVMKTGKVKFPPTFYMGAGDKPTFAMEEAVMRIAELDFPEGLEKAGVMGMEWWCQVAPDGVGTGTMHFDKDEGRTAVLHQMKLAMRSTVTYLTEAGSPTAIFNARYRPGPIFQVEEIGNEAWIVTPEVNKHISFQGDLYHGILHHIYPPAAAQRGKLRATLLVNYWEDKPMEPHCLRFPNVGGLEKFPAGTVHPKGAAGVIEEMDMRPAGLKKHVLPCDTGARQDLVWFPKARPAPRKNYHMDWPKGFKTERQFRMEQKSRWAGDPMPGQPGGPDEL